MKTKSMVQLLIPAASTVLLFILFWLLSFVIWVIGYLLVGFLEIEPGAFEDVLGRIYDFLQVNIFEYRDGYSDVNINTVVFWIINVMLIIVGELWASTRDDEYFDM